MSDMSIGFSSSYLSYGQNPLGQQGAGGVVRVQEEEQPHPSTADENKTEASSGNEDPTKVSEERSSNRSQYELSPEETQQIAELKSRDMQVRAHEAAHVAAGGRYITSGASFSYQSGPDGRRYAIGGEVSIDTAAIQDNPEATILKMQTVQAAAMAPADPSSTDISVAAKAGQKAAQARAELSKKRLEELKGDAKELSGEEIADEAESASGLQRGAEQAYGIQGKVAPGVVGATANIPAGENTLNLVA